MSRLAVFLILSALAGVADGPERDDARLLVEAMESLQQPLQDFRCEYEGLIRAREKVAEAVKVAEDGVFESFTGIFVWKAGGDTRIESLRRRSLDTQILSETVVVRMQQQEAEEYSRFKDTPLGRGKVKNPKDVRTWNATYGTIFLIDRIKREVVDPALVPSVSTDRLDGRPVKVLSIGLQGLPGSLFFRYWIDLNRNGHVVREEDYAADKAMASRLDITLSQFRVDGADFWMPSLGELVGYQALVDKKPVVMARPQVFERVYLVDGTIEFNKHPRPAVFTISYKLGTPISDGLRKLQYEFGEQRVGPNPSKAEVQRMLDEQVAMAEKQKAELVVASRADGVDWTRWAAWAFGVLAVVSSAGVWMQNRRQHR